VPRTSVITLTENRPKYLEEARYSIDVQIDRDWEHFIYNRGWPMPPDGISQTKWYDWRNRRVEMRLRHSEPEIFTVGHYWNVLLDWPSQSKYVTILDDDNRKRPDFIEKMIAPMEADESVEAVSCGWQIIDGTGQLFDEVHTNLETSIPRLWRDNTIDSNAVVFRRSVLDKIGKFDASLTTNEDWHFIIRLVRACKMVHLPDTLLDYRVHDKARSRDAVALGAHLNWHRIRKELFTKAEWREAIQQSEEK
jgi:GT2 family glycosyltransferase